MTDLRYSRPSIEVTVVVEMARCFGRAVGEVRAPAEALTRTELAEVEQLGAILAADSNGPRRPQLG